MTAPIIECIPNFSEGRRPEVVDAIAEAIASVSGVTLLDRSSDADHNRSVLTFVGAPAAVEEAALRSIAKAAELIDMETHTGEHPRMGAADVVPFVPIAGISMEECVQLAHRVGQRVGDELGIPVYLYEEAASKASRRNLENVRRGEYEGIRAEIGRKASRKPDYGPNALGKAGAVAIGARQPLIAYNVYLNTGDVEVAKAIGKAVRHSSGGFRFVKGAGFLVDGLAQVSMNLTNYTKTPLARVVEAIRREAARYGASIVKTELVGLIPQQAMEDAAAWYLQLDAFDPQQVLERRMQSAAGAAAEDFVEALASAAPAPGGGSAAAHSGALAAALVAMVARLTISKKKYATVEAQMNEVLAQAEGLRAAFTRAISEDAAAFDAVMAAFKLAKDAPGREAAIEAATLEAARQPLVVARMARDCLRLAQQAAALGNINTLSDAGTAGALAAASLQGAGLNVRINLNSVKGSKETRAMLAELQELQAQAVTLDAEIRTSIEERGGF
ncbi:MAG: glutamate formimidoyltransferase [Anaerolineales bacterium]|nr:glutamate formimidoyltransferase [Anaerolineales bacterium]